MFGGGVPLAWRLNVTDPPASTLFTCSSGTAFGGSGHITKYKVRTLAQFLMIILFIICLLTLKCRKLADPGKHKSDQRPVFI